MNTLSLLNLKTLRGAQNTALFFLLAIFISACGGDGSPGSQSPDENSSTPDELPPSTGPDGDKDIPATRFSFANQCYMLQSVSRELNIAKQANGSYATADSGPVALFLRPTALGRYLLFDTDSVFIAVLDATGTGLSLTIGAADTASPDADWSLELDENGAIMLQSFSRTGLLAVAADGSLELVNETTDNNDSLFRLLPAGGCADFPEARLGAAGETFNGRNADGTVFGLADAHTHITAFERLGGRTIYGDAFHPYGVTHALADCSIDHGPNGSTDGIGNFLRDGVPTGTHETEGWPNFPNWPNWRTYSHQQSYYIWVKRMWMAGLRLLVNHTSADEVLCQLAPMKDEDNACSEMDNVRGQIRVIYELQDYIDAQNGGPGMGWFRIVTSSAQARSEIEAGKLAVVIGIEASKLFGCGEFLDAPECDEAAIDAGIDEFHALGVRTVFPAHWVDNAFTGAGLFDVSEVVLNVFNKIETGHYYAVEGCPEPDMGANLMSAGMHFEGDNPLTQALNEAQSQAVPTYPEGPHCNARGLHTLGSYVINRLIDKGILIDTDHIGVRAKEAVFDIANERGVPTIAGHYHAGGITSETQFRGIFDRGGLAAPLSRSAAGMIEQVQLLRQLSSPEFYFGVGIASDTGGLASQIRPRSDAADSPLEYPFTSYDGRVTFTRQQTGDRVYDLNQDGTAHYGLFADWLADIGRMDGGPEALATMFRSAEAYLQMWARVEAAASTD